MCYAHVFTCLVNKSSSMHSLCIIIVLKSEFHTAIYKQSLAQYVLCLKNILLLHHSESRSTTCGPTQNGLSCQMGSIPIINHSKTDVLFDYITHISLFHIL